MTVTTFPSDQLQDLMHGYYNFHLPTPEPTARGASVWNFIRFKFNLISFIALNRNRAASCGWEHFEAQRAVNRVFRAVICGHLKTVPPNYPARLCNGNSPRGNQLPPDREFPLRQKLSVRWATRGLAEFPEVLTPVPVAAPPCDA